MRPAGTSTAWLYCANGARIEVGLSGRFMRRASGERNCMSVARRGRMMPALSPSRQTSPASASPMRACRYASSRRPASQARRRRPRALRHRDRQRPHRHHRSARCRTALPRFDLDSGIVLPRFVDVHTHIDKGHIWRARPIRTARFMGARTTVMADREANWSAEDVRKRMDFALRCAFAHGTGALRTHIDSIGKQTGISWPVFAEMREPGKAASRCRRSRSFRSTSRSTTSRIPRHGRDGRAPWRRARRPHLSGRAARRRRPTRRSTRCSRPRRRTASISISMSTRATRPMRARSSASPRPRCATSSRASIVAGHCCSLALADDAERAATIAKVAEARHRGRVAADVQHVSAGPRSPAARRAGAASRRCTSSPPPASP